MGTLFDPGIFSIVGLSGEILPGASLAWYQAGTSTPLDTYADEDLTTPNTNPVPVGNDGRIPPIWLKDASYKLVLLDPNNAPLMTREPIAPVSFAGGDGASKIGYTQGVTGDQLWNVQDRLRQSISVMGFIPEQYRAAIIDRSSTQDVTTYVQAALNAINTATVGAFELFFPDGTYCVSGTGARILQIQNTAKIIGASLEGTRLKVLSGSTAPVFIEDSGNAAKIEINNITFDGNGNTALTAGIRLGKRSVQFGTWGTIDNVSVRDMPNATAVDVNANIVAVGKVYTLNTTDGLVSSGAGSGFHVETFTPTDFTGSGVSLSLADSINYVEAEAPDADTAVPIAYERGGFLLNYYLSIGANRAVRTPVRINPTYVADWMLGPTVISYADATATYGDTVAPDTSGTATSGSPTTLTDTSKSWTRDQWHGAALKIVAGTGAGQFRRIATNSKDTIVPESAFTTTPDATSQYALSYFIRKSADNVTFTGGYGHSRSLTAYWPWFYNLSVGNQVSTNALQVGPSNDSTPITGIMRAVASLTFPAVAAGGVQSQTVTVRGAQVSMPVILGVPNAVQSIAGLSVGASVSAADTVTIYVKNTSGGSITPAVATWVATVLNYG